MRDGNGENCAVRCLAASTRSPPLPRAGRWVTFMARNSEGGLPRRSPQRWGGRVEGRRLPRSRSFPNSQRLNRGRSKKAKTNPLDLLLRRGSFAENPLPPRGKQGSRVTAVPHSTVNARNLGGGTIWSGRSTIKTEASSTTAISRQHQVPNVPGTRLRATLITRYDPRIQVEI